MERPGLKAGAFIALLAFSWAAPTFGAAHFLSSAVERPNAAEPSSTPGATNPKLTVPDSVRLKVVRGRGLLVNVWINGIGPYAFAVDTGAGTTVLRSDVARRAGLIGTAGHRTSVGGLSGATAVLGQATLIKSLALGEPNNLLPSRHRALIVPALPEGIDGILDPTEAYAPFGYVIDIPNRELSAFDTRMHRLQLGQEPSGGAVVRWVRESDGMRPFVRLGDNRLALIDTGSGFGLAVVYDAIVSGRNHQTPRKTVRDLGGGQVESRRVAPTTVMIGSLVLQKVPTDILIGGHEDAPVILGRDALYPFRMTFDPASRLIEIAPSGQD